MMISALCTRAALLLRLDLNPRHNDPKNCTTDSITKTEIRRRVFWACWNIENTVGVGAQRMTALSGTVPGICLPCSESDFLHQRSGLPQTLLSTLEADIPRIEAPSSGISSAYIQIMTLRSMVLRYIRVSAPQPFPWQSGSRFFVLTELLERWRAVLPASIVLSEQNAYIHCDQHQLGLYFATHIVYHLCYCDLFRVMMPGYDFPLRRALTTAPPDFITYYQSQCTHHAELVSEVLRLGQRHGRSAFDDRIYQAACYESCRLQLAGLKLPNIQHIDPEQTSKNLITNLDILLSHDSGRFHTGKLKPLIRDIRNSGLTGAATYCVQRLQSSGDTTPSESDNSRPKPSDDVDYLHPLHPFRNAVNEATRAAHDENSDVNVRLHKEPTDSDVSGWQQNHTSQDVSSNHGVAAAFGEEEFREPGVSTLLFDGESDASDPLFWDPLAPWVFDAFRFNEDTGESQSAYIESLPGSYIT